MKKTVTVLMCIMCFIACDKNEVNETNFENESLPVASSSRSYAENETVILELHLHQYYLENKLFSLRQIIEALSIEIENGDESKISDLEEAKIAYEESLELSIANRKSLNFIRIPRDLPPFPNPCGSGGGDDLNCLSLNLADVFSLLTAKNSGEVFLMIKDVKGSIVNKQPDYIEEYEGSERILVHTLKLKIEEGIISITKKNPISGKKLSYDINFVKE